MMIWSAHAFCAWASVASPRVPEAITRTTAQCLISESFCRGCGQFTPIRAERFPGVCSRPERGVWKSIREIPAGNMRETTATPQNARATNVVCHQQVFRLRAIADPAFPSAFEADSGSLGVDAAPVTAARPRRLSTALPFFTPEAPFRPKGTENRFSIEQTRSLSTCHAVVRFLEPRSGGSILARGDSPSLAVQPKYSPGWGARRPRYSSDAPLLHSWGVDIKRPSSRATLAALLHTAISTATTQTTKRTPRAASPRSSSLRTCCSRASPPSHTPHPCAAHTA